MYQMCFSVFYSISMLIINLILTKKNLFIYYIKTPNQITIIATRLNKNYYISFIHRLKERKRCVKENFFIAEIKAIDKKL